MSTNILMLIGSKIRDIRKQKGLSQEQLGEKAGFHFSYIGGVERGEKNITILNLEKIATALDVAVQDFFPKSELPQSRKDMELHELLNVLLRLDPTDLSKVKIMVREFFS